MAYSMNQPSASYGYYFLVCLQIMIIFETIASILINQTYNIQIGLEISIKSYILLRIILSSQISMSLLVRSSILCLLCVSFRYMTRLMFLFQFSLIEIQQRDYQEMIRLFMAVSKSPVYTVQLNKLFKSCKNRCQDINIKDFIKGCHFEAFTPDNFKYVISNPLSIDAFAIELDNLLITSISSVQVEYKLTTQVSETPLVVESFSSI